MMGFRAFVYAAIIFLWTGQAFAFRIESIDGSLPRNVGTSDSFTITLKVADLLVLELPPANPNLDLLFFITINGDSKAIPFNVDTAKTSGVTFYSILLNNNTIQTTQPDGKISISYNIQFNALTADALKQSTAAGKLHIKVKFTTGTSTAESEKDLASDNTLFVEAPEFEDNAIVGSHQSVTVFFKSKTNVQTNTANATKAPAGINVFAFPADDNTLSRTLPATIVGTTPADDKDTSCYLLPPGGDGGPCIMSCDGENADKTNVTLKATKIRDLGYSYSSVPASQGSLIIGGLDNTKSYFVFMEYDSGTKASQCIKGQPSQNFTLTELNGEGEAQVVDLRCFIATAAYGTPLAKDLRIFRQLRDQILLKNLIGRLAVDFYYRVSPPLADLISHSPSLKEISHDILAKVASMIHSWIKVDVKPQKLNQRVTR